ncbi:NusA-like transcription termination signal-binding factor [Candidatus Woesearchaeota archaeon]|nr:NusA-like transcription termination signal-binding factor [Candidatus Woesearchaeota archaeon]
MTEKISFDTDMLKLMGLFDKITHAKLKDCFFDREKLVFLVEPGELGKALGKNKENVPKIEKLLNRKIKIVEFSPTRLGFIKNYITPLKIEGISEEGDIVTIVGSDTKTKGLLIGIKAQNLRNLEKIVGKYYTVQEIKVV